VKVWATLSSILGWYYFLLVEHYHLEQAVFLECVMYFLQSGPMYAIAVLSDAAPAYSRTGKIFLDSVAIFGITLVTLWDILGVGGPTVPLTTKMTGYAYFTDTKNLKSSFAATVILFLGAQLGNSVFSSKQLASVTLGAKMTVHRPRPDTGDAADPDAAADSSDVKADTLDGPDEVAVVAVEEDMNTVADSHRLAKAIIVAALLTVVATTIGFIVDNRPKWTCYSSIDLCYWRGTPNLFSHFKGSQAVEICSDQGGTLATIASETEHAIAQEECGSYLCWIAPSMDSSYAAWVSPDEEVIYLNSTADLGIMMSNFTMAPVGSDDHFEKTTWSGYASGGWFTASLEARGRPLCQKPNV